MRGRQGVGHLGSLFPVYKVEPCRAVSILTSEENAQPGTVEGGHQGSQSPESPQAAALTSGETHRGCRGLTGEADMKELKEFWEESASDWSHVPSPPFPAPVMPTHLCGPRADHLEDHSGQGPGPEAPRLPPALHTPTPTPTPRKQEG